MIDLGFVGVASVAMLVISSLLRCKRLLAEGGDQVFQFYFALVSAGIVHGFAEVSFVYPRALGFFLAIAFCSIIYRHQPALAADAALDPLDNPYPTNSKSQMWGPTALASS